MRLVGRDPEKKVRAAWSLRRAGAMQTLPTRVSPTTALSLLRLGEFRILLRGGRGKGRRKALTARGPSRRHFSARQLLSRIFRRSNFPESSPPSLGRFRPLRYQTWKLLPAPADPFALPEMAPEEEARSLGTRLVLSAAGILLGLRRDFPFRSDGRKPEL